MVKPITTCHPETPFVVWPCDEERRHECCKACNNDEGGREETSRKAQTEVDGQSVEHLHQLEPKLAQNKKYGETQSWRSTPDRDKIGKGEQR